FPLTRPRVNSYDPLCMRSLASRICFGINDVAADNCLLLRRALPTSTWPRSSRRCAKILTLAVKFVKNAIPQQPTERQMKVPAVQGMIERRLLVNYRIAPDALSGILPPPFRPKLVGGYAIAGICLIRLASVRPRGLPAGLGLRSENAA